MSAAIGGVVSGISGAAQEKQIREYYENQVREYSKNNIGLDGKSSSTIDAKILGQKTGKTQIIHKNNGERIILKADGGENKRVQNYKYMDEGHYRPADKSGQEQISRTDFKQDGNCFMHLAKQQLNAKSTQDARQQLNDFAQENPLTAAKFVTKQELMQGGYCKGGGLENIESRFDFREINGMIQYKMKKHYNIKKSQDGDPGQLAINLHGTGKNSNVVKYTDEKGKVQFYRKGPYYKQQDLEKNLENYQKLEKLGVGLPVQSEDNFIFLEPGQSIKDAIRKEVLPPDFADQLTKQVKILEQNGLAHCDIKPDNVVVYKGKIKLIDAECLTKFKEQKPQFSHNSAKIVATPEIDKDATKKTIMQITNLQKNYKSGTGNQTWD